MTDLTVIIPARNEPYLNKTTEEILTKSGANVCVILDGYDYEPPKINYPERISYLAYPKGKAHLREAMNKAVAECNTKYVMKLDAHCLLDENFDQKLIEAHHPNWVQIPRRKRLDANNWKVIEDGRMPVDYEYIIFPHLLFNPDNVLSSKGFIWGSPWDELAKERADILIDDTPHIQGSCYFMEKSWFNRCGFMDMKYTNWAMEAEEVVFKTVAEGGRAVVNKTTWYAHLHKSREDRRWFKIYEEDNFASNSYAYNLWIRDNRDFFIKFIEKFPLMPDWKVNWKEILWN